MYCPFCGQEVRQEAIFCSACGKQISGVNTKQNDATRKEKAGIFKDKKGLIIAIVALLILFSVIKSLSQPSIVGVWMDGTKQVIFTKSGDYKSGSNYGTYTITADKTLEIQYGEYSYNSGRPTYEWGAEAKEDSDYWYISGGTLYFKGGEYTKK